MLYQTLLLKNLLDRTIYLTTGSFYFPKIPSLQCRKQEVQAPNSLKEPLSFLKKKQLLRQSSYERAAADGGASALGWLATGVVSSLSRGQMCWQRYTTMLLGQKTPTEQMKGRGTRLVCERMSRNTNVASACCCVTTSLKSGVSRLGGKMNVSSTLQQNHYWKYFSVRWSHICSGRFSLDL